MIRTLEGADQGADLIEEIEPKFEIGDMLFSLFSEPLKILDIKADTYVAIPDQPYYLVLNTLGFENKLYFDDAHRSYFKIYNKVVYLIAGIEYLPGREPSDFILGIFSSKKEAEKIIMERDDACTVHYIKEFTIDKKPGEGK